LTHLYYKGNPVYLPPKYFSNPETIKIYIPKEENGKLPKSELTSEEENQLVFANPPGILLNPPGIGLTKLFEKTLRTNLTQVDLKFLQKNMSNLLVESLELCQEFEMKVEKTKIDVNIVNILFKADKDFEENQSRKSEAFSPLTSSIACAIAKTTGQPISVEHVQSTNDGQDLAIKFGIFTEE
jgi:hypothetical protein